MRPSAPWRKTTTTVPGTKAITAAAGIVISATIGAAGVGWFTLVQSQPTPEQFSVLVGILVQTAVFGYFIGTLNQRVKDSERRHEVTDRLIEAYRERLEEVAREAAGGRDE